LNITSSHTLTEVSGTFNEVMGVFILSHVSVIEYFSDKLSVENFAQLVSSTTNVK